MRKLLFISVVGLGVVGASGDVFGIFNFFIGSQDVSKSTEIRNVVTHAELSEKERVEEGHKDDMKNQAEI